ncbi:MAG: type I restriction enzyme HsdR N-terminal domain-containing protein [Bacteroidales bacterium]|nr:type I restriction enzyme HsdR N-terminal domain-containing protein [Bacteroidales bacterium]
MQANLNLPPYDFKSRVYNGQHQIYDGIRRKYVILTPEEWVRQHFVNYLTTHKGYPVGLINIEFPVTVNGMLQRADIVAYGRSGNPLLIVECKAPTVKLDATTFSQAARYNLTLKANYLVVTNGIKHYCSMVDLQSKQFKAIPEVPDFKQIG